MKGGIALSFKSIKLAIFITISIWRWVGCCSWAVPKGPPLEPGIRRLAIQVEDHPVDYIDFAGGIPQGEYGAGSVEIWDKGEFDLEKESADILEFSLRGKKLSGSYALIHTGDKNWLFIRRKKA